MDPSSAFTWITGPWWDGFFVFSGLWVVAIFCWAEISYRASVNTAVVVLAIGNLAFWAGHNLSPIMMAWSDGRLRTHMMNRRWLYVGFPLALLVLAIVFEILGQFSEPFSYVFFSVYLVWNSWHFGSQHFGILTLYRRRVRPEDENSRFWDSVYCRLLFCGAIPLAWFSESQFLGPLFRFLPSPGDGLALKTGVVGFSLVFMLFMIARELFSARISVQRIFYFVLVGVQPILAALYHPLIHFALYTSTHYMLVIGMVALMFSRQNKNVFGLPKTWHIPGFIRSNATLHFFSLLLWSPLLYAIIYSQRPRFGMQPVHHYALSWGQHFPFLNWLLNPRPLSPAWIGVLTGLYYGLALTHFFYDRFVYQFQKNPMVTTTLMDRE